MGGAKRVEDIIKTWEGECDLLSRIFIITSQRVLQPASLHAGHDAAV